MTSIKISNRSHKVRIYLNSVKVTLGQAFDEHELKAIFNSPTSRFVTTKLSSYFIAVQRQQQY